MDTIKDKKGRTFSVGGIVRYSAKFLRDIGDYSAQSANRKMKVKSISRISRDYILLYCVDMATGEEEGIASTNAIPHGHLEAI